MRNDPVLAAYVPFAAGSQGTQFPLPPEVAARTEELVRGRWVPLPAEAVVLSAQPEGALLPTGTVFGGSYRLADEEYSTTIRELIRPDQGRIERANQCHAKLQNQLASYLRSRGLVPRSYGVGEPNFDIG
jgi:hypothetical protein